MVAGDHHRLDAGLAAGGNRGLGLGTGRVNHAHQAQKGQAVFQLLAGGVLRRLLQEFIAHRQHPQGAAAHLVVFLLGGFQVARDAPGGHHVESALDNGHDLPVDLVDRGHQLPVRVKGQLCQPGILPVQLILLHAVFVGRHQNGGLGGVAYMLLGAVLFVDH